MTLRIGVVMDPIATIKPYKDTTLAMLLEAQERGHAIDYMELPDLWLRDGEAFGSMRPLRVRDTRERWHDFGPHHEAPLSTLDVILMRKDPPVDDAFVYATHMLELAEAGGVLVVNRPRALRDAQEKLFTARFPQCCAPTLVSGDAGRLKAFLREHGHIVLKPLHGMGGESIFVVREDDPNVSVMIETLTAHGRLPIIAQTYLPAIRDGDKRILLVDGTPVDHALARIPAAGETRGNIAAGGRGEAVPLSDRDRWICEQVAPELRRRGLWFVGLDVIGDSLTEINVTSPTCVRELDQLMGLNIAGSLFDAIEGRLLTPRQ